MEAVRAPHIPKQATGLKGEIKRHLLTWLRLSDQPSLKLYRGFGNHKQLTVHGTAFRRSAETRQKYRSTIWLNFSGLLRMFLVKPLPHGTVRIQVNGQQTEAQTDDDGYFRIEIPLTKPVVEEWCPVQAELLLDNGEKSSSATSRVLVPSATPFGCISDIDDTFLISYSAALAKRLRELITKNPHTRKPFEGVVQHYQMLAEASGKAGSQNPFFYVSSSEWNLYDYILEFTSRNGLPEGVYLLSPLKRLKDVFRTGQGKHMTKFTRIVQILETYPAQPFVLLGDDTQEDPAIYASVVRHFPGQIRAVYIRQVYGKRQVQTRDVLKEIDAAGVPVCYFAHSRDARQHSIDIRLTNN